MSLSIELPASLTQGLLTGGPAFCALLLGYSYFVMGWATTRMHDWESTNLTQKGQGSPALVVWTSGVATLMAAVLGVNVFLFLYAGLVREIGYLRWSCLIAMGLISLCLWFLLIRWLWWGWRNRSTLDRLSDKHLKKLVSWERPAFYTMPFFLVVAIISFWECFVGKFEAGLMGLLFLLTGSFGIGGYCPLRGDLMVRAVIQQESVDKEPSDN